MLIPVVIVLGLMGLSLAGAAFAHTTSLKATLAPGVSSINVTPGQQLFLSPPAGGAWTMVMTIVNNAAVQLPFASPTSPVSFTVPPAVTSIAASWTLNGAPQGAIVLLVPPGQNGASVITDPTTVGYAQTQLTAVANKGLVPNLSYGTSGSNQTFAAGIQTFQTWANATILGTVGTQIRTDGQLDYATFSLLTSVASGF